MTTPDPTKPWAGYIQDQQYSAFQDRMIQIGKVNHQALVSGLNTRNGVFLGGGDGNTNINLNVRAAGGMDITIDAGSAIVDGYSVINPIRQSMTVEPSTTVARRDAVILRVYDTEAGDLKSGAFIEIVKGTNTSDPPMPPRYHLLAVIDVAANATSIVPQDRRDFTTAVGGVVPYYEPRVPDIKTIANGQIIHDLNTGLNDQRDGDSFHPLGANVIAAAAYDNNNLEQINIGVFGFKNWNFTFGRQANFVVIYSVLNIHCLDAHSTVMELGTNWDGNQIGGYVANTTGNEYTVHSWLGFAANQGPGTHTITIHVKPTLGSDIQISQWYGWAIAIS